MKETFYFAHDYNARNDPKLQNVLFDLGVEGIGVFWCFIEELNRLKRRTEVSENRKLAALARWRQGIENQSQTQVQASYRQVKDNASDMQMQCKTDANAEHKGKEIKEKEIIKEREKEKTAQRFIPPTVEEVKARIDEMGYTFDAEAFIAFYQSNGWMVGKSKMKDWRAAMVTWQKREPRFPRGGKSSSTSKKANEEW